jgi:hypothetical protein
VTEALDATPTGSEITLAALRDQRKRLRNANSPGRAILGAVHLQEWVGARPSDSKRSERRFTSEPKLGSFVQIASLRSLRAPIVALAVVAAIAATLLELGVCTRTVTFSGPFHADRGHAFRVDLRTGSLRELPFMTGGDGSQWPTSRLRLFEDGAELTQAHTLHETIRSLGGGRFSHWHDSLYFSATDNSDPNTSGHVYTAVYSWKFRGWISSGIIVALLIGLRLYGREIREILDRGRRALPAVRYGQIRLAMWSLVLVACVAIPVYVVVDHLASGRTTPQSIGGLIPWTDSGAWVFGALRTLVLGEAHEWSARRPINTAFLASLLAAAGHSLPIALLIRAVCLGAVVYLFILQTSRSFGAVAALIGAAVIYGFADPFLSVGLSEVNGLIFGTLGISILLHAVQAKTSVWLALGLFFLTMGLLTRSGAALILPALLAWSAFSFAETRRVVIRPVIVGSCAIAAAWLMSKVLAYAYMPPGISDNANFSYVLYGLAKGGQSWMTFCDDIARLDGTSCFSTADSVLAKIAYARSIELILADPRPFLKGVLNFTLNFLRDIGNYLPMTGRRVLLILGMIGLLSSIFGHAGAPGRFALAALIGIVASAGVIYWSEDGYRLFAATMAIDALIVAAGVDAARRFVTRAAAPAHDGNPENYFDFAKTPALAGTAGAFGMLLVAFTALAPVVFRMESVPAASASSIGCPTDERKMTIQLGRSSIFIRLTSAHDAFAPEVAYDNFHRDPRFGDVEIAEFLRTLKVGDMLIAAIDLGGETTRGERLWLRMSDAGSLVDGRFYVLCARQGTIEAGTNSMTIYTVTAFREIRAQP